MGKSYGKNKGRMDAPGGFAGIPRVVMDHSDYQNLKGSAVKLLLELARQYNGKNNGDLTTAQGVVGKRGLGAQDTVRKATQELLEARLIIQTREGRFMNPGARCALYALTWKPIDECPGKQLNIQPTATPPRKFSLEINKTPAPESGDSSHQKLGRQKLRDAKGRYSSHQKLVRLVDTPYTKNW